VGDGASYEFALASAAVVLTVASGNITYARIALGGVGTLALRGSRRRAHRQSPERQHLPPGSRSGAASRDAAEREHIQDRPRQTVPDSGTANGHESLIEEHPRRWRSNQLLPLRPSDATPSVSTVRAKSPVSRSTPLIFSFPACSTPSRWRRRSHMANCSRWILRWRRRCLASERCFIAKTSARSSALLLRPVSIASASSGGRRSKTTRSPTGASTSLLPSRTRSKRPKPPPMRFVRPILHKRPTSRLASKQAAIPRSS